MKHHQKIIDYYNNTEYEYRAIWHYKLEGAPALHFGYYDQKASKHKDAINRVNEILADMANIKPGDRVLDAGCGLGHTCIWLAKERNAVTTGISIVKEQLKKATDYAKEMGLEGVTFVDADYLNTPFGDEYFDVVWGIESVCHADDKSLFYKEAFRILKPGGRLVLADSFRKERPLPEKGERLLKKAFSGWQISDIDTADEHRDYAKTAGFGNIKIVDVSENMMISYKNLYHHVRNYLWLVYILKWLGFINKLRLYNARSSGKQYKALKTGVFRYMHLLALKPADRK